MPLEDAFGTRDALVLEGDAGVTVVDDDRVLEQVGTDLVVELGACAGGVHHDGEEAVVAGEDLVLQVEVDEEHAAHVGDLTFVDVAVPVDEDDVLGLPVGVGLVGPGDHVGQATHGQGRALGDVVADLQGQRTEVLRGRLAARSSSLGLLDGQGVAHDDFLTVRGQDVELADASGRFDASVVVARVLGLDAGVTVVAVDVAGVVAVVGVELIVEVGAASEGGADEQVDGLGVEEGTHVELRVEW